MSAGAQRLAWVVTTIGLLAGLLALDANRGGPATPMSRCNLALTRSGEAPAEVLVLGSSRTGTAVDPVAMEAMLGVEPDLGRPSVERIALARNPLRANVALLETYLTERGRPQVIVFEIAFVTPRVLDRIEQLGSGLRPEAFLFRRDINLMRYDQLLTMPAVALPDSEAETVVNRMRYRLRGAVLRTGALTYQFARQPGAQFSLDGCTVATWTREPGWPSDFAFSWNDADEVGPAADRIDALRAEVTADGEQHAGATREYPYDIDQPYRAGELALLDAAVGLAADHDIPVVLLPLTTVGTHASEADMASLDSRFDGDATVYDLYRATDVEVSMSWYDDAHLDVATAGQLTTALLAQHLIDMLSGGGQPSMVVATAPQSAAPSGE